MGTHSIIYPYTTWNRLEQCQTTYWVPNTMITTTTTTTIEYERIVFLGEIPVPFIGIMFHIYIQRRLL